MNVGNMVKLGENDQPDAAEVNWNLWGLWRNATAKGVRGALAYYEGRQSPPIKAWT